MKNVVLGEELEPVNPLFRTIRPLIRSNYVGRK